MGLPRPGASTPVHDYIAQHWSRMVILNWPCINDHNYQQVTSVYDPNGIVDPNDSSQVAQFAKGVSTTSDSSITLVNVTPSDGSMVQTAEVQFTSNQQAGFGPKDNPESTCTNWDVTYTLTLGSSNNYLINSVSSASDSAC